MKVGDVFEFISNESMLVAMGSVGVVSGEAKDNFTGLFPVNWIIYIPSPHESNWGGVTRRHVVPSECRVIHD